jgi:mono/diheme cytochrome c family protein
LTVWPILRDRHDPGAQIQRRQAEEDATRSFALATQGIPPGGAEDLYLNDPHERGWRLFAVNCQACHKAHGKGGTSAPDLTGFMNRDWIRGVIAYPNAPQYYGPTRVNTMPETEATPKELDLLTDYVLSLRGAVNEPPGGGDLFEEKGCQSCHARADEGPRSAASLAGYGSRAWMVGAIKNPAHPAYYGAQNQMPAFDGKLTDADIDDLLACLLSPVPPLGARR